MGGIILAGYLGIGIVSNLMIFVYYCYDNAKENLQRHRTDQVTIWQFLDRENAWLVMLNIMILWPVMLVVGACYGIFKALGNGINWAVTQLVKDAAGVVDDDEPNPEVI